MSRRATVVGVGLIGGSIGMALREAGWHVSGVDSDGECCVRGLELGAIDAVGWDPDRHVDRSSLTENEFLGPAPKKPIRIDRHHKCTRDRPRHHPGVHSVRSPNNAHHAHGRHGHRVVGARWKHELGGLFMDQPRHFGPLCGKKGRRGFNTAPTAATFFADLTQRPRRVIGRGVDPRLWPRGFQGI